MNQLAVVLGFLAARPERQVELLPSLPLDPGAPDFHTRFIDNPLLGIAESYHRFLRFEHDEPWDVFLERLGVPASTLWPPSAEELDHALYTIKPSDHALWTRKALMRRVEWRLVRRMAAITLGEFGWSPLVERGDLEEVLTRYTPILKTCWREEGQPWAHG